MIKFQVLEGKYNKSFVQVITDYDEEDDARIVKLIKQVCTRSEYKPYIKSFNKNITASFYYDQRGLECFPVQFWNDVKKILDDLDYPCKLVKEEKLIDKRCDWDSFQKLVQGLKLPEKISTTDEKYSYQQYSAFECVKHRFGRIEVGTSGGKTFITYLMFRYINELYDTLPQIDKDHRRAPKILIVVPRRNLAEQFIGDTDEFQEFEDDSKRIKISTVYSAPQEQLKAQVIIGTYQMLSNFDKEYFDEFTGLIVDEAHTSKAYSIKQEIFAKMYHCEYVIGMSGTYPEYNTLDYLNIVSMFGPVRFQKLTHELIEDGVSTPIDIKVLRINYKGSYAKELKDAGIVGLEKYHAELEYIANLESRNKLIIKLLTKLSGNSLVLFTKIEYINSLSEMFGAFIAEHNLPFKYGVIHGTIPLKRRLEIIQDCKDNDNYVIFATYDTMSTGISINNLSNLVLPDPIKAFIKLRQSIGRTIRLHPDKKVAKIYDIYDNMTHSALKKHGNQRLKIYDEQKFPYTILDLGTKK